MASGENRRRAAGAGIGVVFGPMLSWSGMTSPDVIRSALLLQKSYLFLFFASAVLTAAVGLELVRRRERRALLTDAQVEIVPEKPERRHVTGALLFGVGWGVADACPGPIATQIGQGIGWAVFTLAGVVIGVWLFQRRGAVETEPSADRSTRGAVLRRPLAAEAARARGS